MKSKSAIRFSIIVLIVFVFSYLAVFGLSITNPNIQIPSVAKARFGIDIMGGVRIVFGAAEDISPSDKDLNTIERIINKRLDNKNIYDRNVVQEKSTGRIIVEIPWQAGETEFDPSKAVDELGKTALLSFRAVEFNEEAGSMGVSEEILVNGKDVTDAYTQLDQETGKTVVSLEFNSEGTKDFAQATEILLNKPLGIFLDDDLISAPMVNQKIPNGRAIISIGGTDSKEIAEEARDLAEIIRAGALPFKIEPKDVNEISPLLGQNAKNVTVYAGIVALILVWIFMLFYYRLPGIISNIALLGHTVVSISFITWTEITLTLPGIAGIILSLGMAVDANIIIFERIKEELKAGKTVRLAIDIGFKRAISAIVDSNLTTLITAIVLYNLGSGPIQSFAITLMLGVILSFISAITASRIMIKSVATFKFGKKRWLYGA